MIQPCKPPRRVWVHRFHIWELLPPPCMYVCCVYVSYTYSYRPIELFSGLLVPGNEKNRYLNFQNELTAFIRSCSEDTRVEREKDP